MIPKLPLVAVLAALIILPVARGTEPLVPQRLEMGGPRGVPRPPEIRFSLPRHVLRESERELVAACLVLEAANQGELGLRSVMAVIRNRAQARPERFVATVLRPKQFSAFNAYTAGRESLSRLLARARRDRTWPTALAIVNEAASDIWHDPTAGATHYTLSAERTAWTRRLTKTVTIGAHSFYR